MRSNFFVQLLQQESKNLFQLKHSDRLWHIPFMAMFAIGVPLLVGWYFDNLQAGLLACLAGLVILYLLQFTYTSTYVYHVGLFFWLYVFLCSRGYF
ncbi:hypothetical protein QNH98_16625 [Myroides sp. mNGS23_01]|nr:hypothetical protein [Myroides sp. mNGS23_01]WHT38605.1 hypothetical protein QNH98_16625 [Myroides sp. mNGS23_01]